MTELSTHEQTQEIILEGLQMATEANSAAMIVFNAKVQMIADHLELDIETPPLSEDEQRNKNAMLKSVGLRLMNIMKMAAAVSGEPEPTPAEAADILENVRNEIWPDGSISGVSGRTRSDVPNDSATPKAGAGIEDVVAAMEAQHPDSRVVDHTIPGGLSPEGYADLEKAVNNAKPVTLAELQAREDDSTVEEDTAAMHAHMKAGVEANNGTFKSTRAPANSLTITVAGLQDFDGVDMTDPEIRQERWNAAVEFYCDCAQEAVTNRLLTQPWADRLKMEFTMSATDPDYDSTLVMPEPGDVSNGVAQTAASGETEIVITGITSEAQVVEAFMTGYMVTASRFNSVISASLLKGRLEQIGMSA